MHFLCSNTTRMVAEKYSGICFSTQRYDANPFREKPEGRILVGWPGRYGGEDFDGLLYFSRF